MTGIKDPEYRGKVCVREQDGDVDVYRMYVPDRANESFSAAGVLLLGLRTLGAWGYRSWNALRSVLCSSSALVHRAGMLLIHRFSRVPMVFEARPLARDAITTGVIRNRRMIQAMCGIERRRLRRGHRGTP